MKTYREKIIDIILLTYLKIFSPEKFKEVCCTQCDKDDIDLLIASDLKVNTRVPLNSDGEITYYIENSTADMPKFHQTIIFRNYFKMLVDGGVLPGYKFKQVKTAKEATIKIYYRLADDDDIPVKFADRKNSIAYSIRKYLGPYSMTMRLNDELDFTTGDDDEGFQLGDIGVHEILHIFVGDKLDHQNGHTITEGCILNARYQRGKDIWFSPELIDAVHSNQGIQL